MSKKDYYYDIDEIFGGAGLDEEEMKMLKELTKLTGDIHFDINTHSLEEIKQAETNIINSTNEILWDTLDATPGARLLIKSKEDFSSLTTAKFINELKFTIAMCDQLDSTAREREDEFEYIADLLGVSVPKNAMIVLKSLYQSCLNFYNTMAEIEKLISTSKDKEQFLNKLTPLNKKALKVLKTLIQNIPHLCSNAEDILPLFKFVYKAFKEDTDDLHIANLKIERPELKSGKKIVFEMTDSDKEHIKYINMANNLYQELMLDYVRDLEKQLPFSAKDLYNKFLEKLNKFKTQFHMPLTRDDSIGHAKECCGKIRKLIEEVSFISENAYTISMYK